MGQGWWERKEGVVEVMSLTIAEHGIRQGRGIHIADLQKI